MIRKSAILSVKKFKLDHSNYHANQCIYAKLRTKNVFGWSEWSDWSQRLVAPVSVASTTPPAPSPPPWKENL